MAILNYTTKIPSSRTVGEIQEILASGGARKVMIDYNADREPESISFQIEQRPGMVVSFRLPCNAQGVLVSLRRDNVESRYQTPEHAQRVAWRVVKDWIEAQMALIHAGQATMLQVYLPYAVAKDGQTIYEQVVNNPKLLT